VARAATKTGPARKAAPTKTAKGRANKGAAKAAEKRPAKAAAPKRPAKAAEKSVTKKSTKAAASKAPVKAAAKKPVKGPTAANGILTLRHMAETLSAMHELPKRQANEILTQVVDFITKSLKKGEKIRLTGLGILQVRKRAARTGRNPRTGEPIKIKASKKIAFRPAKDLKESI
jgi:DNA-binding protein HU-beta